MAEILRYVDPNSTAGGDGTTNALTGAARAYVSLNAWEAAQQQDLTDGGGDTARVVCSSDDAGSTHLADTTFCEIGGWTTSETNRITIEAASSHGGKWNDNIYRRVGSGGLNLLEANITIRGIQFSGSSAGGIDVLTNGWSLVESGRFNILIEKCIGRWTGSTSAGNQPIFLYTYTAATASIAHIWVVRNCVLYGYNSTSGVNTTGIITDNSNPGLSTTYAGIIYSIHNTFQVASTAAHCHWINDKYQTMYILNCGAHHASMTEHIFSHINQTATLTTVGNIITTTTPSFVDEANKDFHLQSGDTIYKGLAADISGYSYNPTDDIDGVSRGAVTGRDVGADEYVAAAGGGFLNRNYWWENY